jgi:hypothetical protein
MLADLTGDHVSMAQLHIYPMLTGTVMLEYDGFIGFRR